MGDQLAKGWADARAHESDWKDSLFAFKCQRRGEQWYFTALGAPSLKPTEAEVQAEEDMLP